MLPNNDSLSGGRHPSRLRSGMCPRMYGRAVRPRPDEPRSVSPIRLQPQDAASASTANNAAVSTCGGDSDERMSSESENEALAQLQSILVSAENAVGFLSGLSGLAAAAVSEAAGHEIDCAVTIKVHRKPTTAAGSSERAMELDQLQQAIGDGPCIKALRDMSPVIINDVSTDLRFPELNRRFAEKGVYSSLGVPLEINGEASAALNFFASKPAAFTPNVYDKAVGFAAAAHNTLQLSVRIGTAERRAEDLEAALQSRTAINLACGVIMAQNRCTQAEAMQILTKVSSNRNRKLREVATELIDGLSGGGIQTHFEA